MRAYLLPLSCAMALGAGPAALAESPVLREAMTLCVANHAEPAKVLAAADTAGWRQPSVDVLGLVPGPNWRVKAIGGGPASFFLTVKEKTNDSNVGKLRTRTCMVSTDAPGSSGLPEAVQALMGRPPQQKAGTVWVWDYEEPPTGGRHFIAADDNKAFAQALTRGSVIVMSVDAKPIQRSVLYRESSVLGTDEGAAAKPQ